MLPDACHPHLPPDSLLPHLRPCASPTSAAYKAELINIQEVAGEGGLPGQLEEQEVHHLHLWLLPRPLWLLRPICSSGKRKNKLKHLIPSFQPSFAQNIPLDEDAETNKMKSASLIMMIGVSGGVGRIVSGFIADLPAIKKNGNQIVLQQVTKKY